MRERDTAFPRASAASPSNPDFFACGGPGRAGQVRVDWPAGAEGSARAEDSPWAQHLVHGRGAGRGGRGVRGGRLRAGRHLARSAGKQLAVTLSHSFAHLPAPYSQKGSQSRRQRQRESFPGENLKRESPNHPFAIHLLTPAGLRDNESQSCTTARRRRPRSSALPGPAAAGA